MIPDLPTLDSAPAPSAGTIGVPADLILSAAAVPGDRLRSISYASLAKAFNDRLESRFEDARPRLEGRLGEMLALRGASDIVNPPSYECYSLLGPYSGPLAQLPPAAAVATVLAQACLAAVERQIPIKIERIRRDVVGRLEAEAARVRIEPPDAARIEHTPEAACAAALAPHFPAPVAHYGANAWPFAGLDETQSTALRRACIEAAAKVLRAVMDKRFAQALAESVPDPDTLAGWASQGWYSTAPGRMDWLDAKDSPMVTSSLRQKFQADYNVVMGPRRKTAAARSIAVIEGSFAVETGIEPEGAGQSCSGTYKATGDELVRDFVGALPGAPSPPQADSLGAKPGLTAEEADAWIRLTCRELHVRTLVRRRSIAREVSHVSDVFPQGLKLAVVSPSPSYSPAWQGFVGGCRVSC